MLLSAILVVEKAAHARLVDGLEVGLATATTEREVETLSVIDHEHR